MNLTINSLPSITWNRLGMNGADVTIEGGFANKTPVVSGNEKDAICNLKAHFPARKNIHLELSAFTRDCDTALIETEENKIMESPIILTYAYDDGDYASRLVLHAKKESNLKVILLLKNEKAAKSTSILETEVYAEEGSHVEIYSAELLGKESIAYNNIGGIADDFSKINLTKLELGAGKLFAGSTINLEGRESFFKAETGYHVKADQSLDMNYNAVHLGKKTESLMEVSGTLEDKGKKIFRGTIDFKRGCKEAVGNENENVLLLGDNMTNQTIPLILCAEEDVEGNHGASIGRLDDKVLFYLGSRGISPQDAQKIIALSRIKSICAKIPDEAVREEIENFEDLRGIDYVPKL